MEQSKRRKIAGTSEAAAAVAANEKQESLTHCPKLLIDCWEKILDYLSVKDIHSLGETCKMLNQLVGGHYLKTYIPDLEYQYQRDGVDCCYGNWFLIEPHFYQFIENSSRN